MKYFSYILILLVFYPFFGCDNNFIEKNHIDADIIFHRSHEAKKKEAPFSDVVQVGNTFYLSGQIGINHKTRELVDGGIVVETTQTLENIKAVLNQHHLEMTDVIKVMVVLDEIEDFAIFNKIYETYFPQKPARTTFAVQDLAKGAKIEIEVIAFKRIR
ncbi:endoribonuclease [Patiriisocius marinistellae]|uniref:Endoribonuclease n=1 Tax=Patiriisocius marinistellae TaxID=2494560 RepID=A0A5J4FWQ9_9FLAO|nr:Rid family detoxifying hydrolase [Patiriisocius marinistellae]GEQ87147.1 endoribonuclease [Patiriisocius marinistellae]